MYAAGLPNQDFSSGLRILPQPFNGKSDMVSLDMYHTLHNQIETRAPILGMAFTQLDGKPYLLAAYFCTLLNTTLRKAWAQYARRKRWDLCAGT